MTAHPDAFAYDILYDNTPHTMLRVALAEGQSVKAQPGAMVAMDPTLDIQGKMEGGLLGGLARKFLTGENFFAQTITAARGPGVVMMAPSILGDIVPLELDGTREYMVQKGGFLASSPGVAIATAMQNLAKGLFSGAGFFVMRATGRGTLFLEAFGSIHPVDLAPGQEYIIDNSHLVAWPADCDYKIQKAATGWLSSLTSGEGVVCRFTGPARILIQTRNPGSFAGWLSALMPSK